MRAILTAAIVIATAGLVVAVGLANGSAHTSAVASVSTGPSARTGAGVDRRVFVVGDSLTVGAEGWLPYAFASHGWELTGVDARNGRKVDEGLDVLRAQAPTLPKTVVIALGTNNYFASPSDVTRWMHTARQIVGSRQIVWIDLCLDSTVDARYAHFDVVNTALDEDAHRYRIQVAHWCTYSTARGIHTLSDGVHYDPASYAVRADFYATAASSLTQRARSNG